MKQFLSSDGGSRRTWNCEWIKIQPVHCHLGLLLMDDVYFLFPLSWVDLF